MTRMMMLFMMEKEEIRMARILETEMNEKLKVIREKEKEKEKEKEQEKRNEERKKEEKQKREREKNKTNSKETNQIKDWRRG